jgi:hypothetical protein
MEVSAMIASRRVARSAVAALVFLAGGCSDDKSPVIVIEGGGFIFNYRIAEVFYGVSVKPMRKLAAGTILEASFENPAGGPPIVVTEPVTGDRVSYGLRTPALSGVKAERDYTVVVVARDRGGQEIGRAERSFRSALDQETNPEKPLTIGPGYTPNPEAQTK